MYPNAIGNKPGKRCFCFGYLRIMMEKEKDLLGMILSLFFFSKYINKILIKIRGDSKSDLSQT